MGALRKPFRDCYQQWLEPGANLTLRLTLSVHVAADGGVTDVDPSVASPPTLIACLVKAAKAARFDPPSNGEATVVEIPVTFVTQ
jgi:outer membrane biosynthesis protein TonB